MVLSNHDFPRLTTRYANLEQSDAIAKLLATLLLTLRGIPFIYYGQEIGMRDFPPETIDEVQDPRGKIRWPKYKGRDGCRTPMQWSSKPQAEFTQGQPWYKIAPDYQYRNVEVQTCDPNSILNYYKKLIRLRHSLPALIQGQLTLLGEEPSVLAYSRSHKNQQVIVLLNMSGDNCQFNLTNLPKLRAKSWQILASSQIRDNQETIGTSINLMPFEGVLTIPNES